MDHPIANARWTLVNLALAEGPRRSRRRTELSPALRGEPAAPAPVDTDDELYGGLAAMPPRQRAVVVLRYFLDLPEAEVAAALQCRAHDDSRRAALRIRSRRAGTGVNAAS